MSRPGQQLASRKKKGRGYFLYRSLDVVFLLYKELLKKGAMSLLDSLLYPLGGKELTSQ